MIARVTCRVPKFGTSHLNQSREPKSVPRHIEIILSSNGTLREGSMRCAQSAYEILASALFYKIDVHNGFPLPDSTRAAPRTAFRNASS